MPRELERWRYETVRSTPASESTLYNPPRKPIETTSRESERWRYETVRLKRRRASRKRIDRRIGLETYIGRHVAAEPS
eukprot:1187331-Pyramimonas_sp.AAC.1